MRLDPRPCTNMHGLLDFGERANKAIVADITPIKIAWLDDLYSRAEDYVLYTDMLDVRFGHGTAPSRLRRGLKRNATSRPVSIELV